MKLRATALVTTLLGLALLLSAQQPVDHTSSINKLKFMTGNWTTTQGNTTIEEYWTQPSAGTMLGMGRTIAGDKTVFFEYLRIETRATGLVYVAHPKAGAGTDFKLKSITDNEVVFENPEHDFPKRIIYKPSAEGNLTARVEGNPGDTEKAETFEYHRIK
jgi:hypothetical protein